MKQISLEEARNYNGGKTYSKKCPVCGEKFSAFYLGPAKSWNPLYNWAVAYVGTAHRTHTNSCLANEYGL